jgi:hypothetical protein
VHRAATAKLRRHVDLQAAALRESRWRLKGKGSAGIAAQPRTVKQISTPAPDNGLKRGGEFWGKKGTKKSGNFMTMFQINWPAMLKRKNARR